MKNYDISNNKPQEKKEETGFSYMVGYALAGIVGIGAILATVSLVIFGLIKLWAWMGIL